MTITLSIQQINTIYKDDLYPCKVDHFAINCYNDNTLLMTKKLYIRAIDKSRKYVSFLETGAKFDFASFELFINNLEKSESAYFAFSEQDGTENVKFDAGLNGGKFTIEFYMWESNLTCYFEVSNDELVQWTNEWKKLSHFIQNLLI